MRPLWLALAVLPGIALPASAMAETVTVDGHPIWYEVHGDLDPGRAPILLLHGGAMNTALAWADLIPVLSQDRPVIGIDQQGHGRSADRDGPITMERMRADTIAVLDALEVETAHVVGFSLGGMLGYDLAVHAPDRVASLSAISAAQGNDGMLPGLVEMNRNPDQPPDPAILALLPTPRDFLKMRRSWEEQNPGGSGAMQQVMEKLGQLIASDWGWSDGELAGITAPTQIILGDTDFLPPEHGAHLAATIPGAWLAVLPDTTHMTILSRPELPGLLTARIEAAETSGQAD